MIQFNYSSIELYKKKEKYLMSSVIGEDIFYYGLYNISNNKLMAVKLISGLPKNYFTDEQQLNKLFDQEGLLGENIAQCKMAFSTEHFSILPTEIGPESLEGFAESFSGLFHDENYVLDFSSVEDLEFKFYYMMPVALKKCLSERFEDFKIHHFNAALLKGVSTTNGNFIFFNFLNDKLQTIVVKDGELLQTNHYLIHGRDDALYFGLLNCRNFDFDPERDSFLLAGTLDVDSPQIQLFQRHFNKLDFIAEKDRLNYSNVFLGKSKHLFFDLECVRICE
jgi:hypothetical protein